MTCTNLLRVLTCSIYFKFGCLSANAHSKSAFSTSINVRAVARNGRPSMTGTSLSSSVSKIKKSAGRINLSTRIKTSSIIPLSYSINRFASCKETDVSFKSPKHKFLKMEKGNRLTLAPKSHKDFIKMIPIVQGIVKLPESFSLGGNFHNKTALLRLMQLSHVPEIFFCEYNNPLKI